MSVDSRRFFASRSSTNGTGRHTGRSVFSSSGGSRDLSYFCRAWSVCLCSNKDMRILRPTQVFRVWDSQVMRRGSNNACISCLFITDYTGAENESAGHEISKAAAGASQKGVAMHSPNYPNPVEAMSNLPLLNTSWGTLLIFFLAWTRIICRLSNSWPSSRWWRPLRAL